MESESTEENLAKQAADGLMLIFLVVSFVISDWLDSLRIKIVRSLGDAFRI